jgi:ankyrin repeat protein
LASGGRLPIPTGGRCGRKLDHGLDVACTLASPVVRARELSATPSLAQLRRQVDTLVAEQRGLADARRVLAREYGFSTWPKLRAYAKRIEAHGPGLQHPYREDIDYYEGRALGLLASARDGTESALAAFRRREAPLTPRGARAVVAGEHGFSSWTGLRRYVATLRDRGDPFARAFRALEAHDVDGLREQLGRFPDLVAVRGTNGNDLLGMATATCDERLVALLLERGADPASANAHGWTALHQAAYSGLPLLGRLLLEAGAPADVSARGDGGTPLIVALFWGHREISELLAERGPFPRNLRAAAGLGRLDLIDELAPADGRLSPEAGAHRAFYRPHGGFPAWEPSDDPQEILDESLSWAARNDRVEALGALVARGASVDADVNRGTALTWAAACGRTRAIERLIELGADPDNRGTFGGPEHGDGTTALHHAAEGGHLDAIRALLDAGADTTVRDALYGGTPADWAGHFGRNEARDLLREAGS